MYLCRITPYRGTQRSVLPNICSYGYPSYLTLSRGVSTDVACHGSPSSPVLSGSLGVHEGETSPLGDVVIHCNLGLPLPRLLSTMPSIRSRCRESWLMMCPKNDSFLIRTVSSNDLLVPANCNTSSFFTRLVQLILSICLNVPISKASRRCCDVLLMINVS